MAYDPNSPPSRIGGDLTRKTGGQMWFYVSADDAATVAAEDYFSNAQGLGMSAYDAVLVVDTTTPLMTSWLVHSVSASGAVLGQSGATIGW